VPMAAVLAVGFGIAAVWWLSHRRNLRIHGEAWRRYNTGAFRPITEPSPDERFEYVTRLADELTTPKGQRAVSMKGDQGWAIQHINKNGTFAKRGPYYVSMYRGTWRPTGRRLLIRTLRGKRGGHGFKADHYDQQGIVYERGEAVLEYDTQRYPEVSLSDFVQMQRHRKTS
jgi:hypothetical protein